MSYAYDFNFLERRAQELIDAARYADAIKIYLFMAEGDPSLDGGYLGLPNAMKSSAIFTPQNTGTGKRSRKIRRERTAQMR